MIIRSPERERERHTGWEARTEADEVQPDPMLRMSEERRASPLAIGLAALFGLIIVATLFYGLNNNPTTNTTTASSEAPTTSGSGPSPSGSGGSSTDANAPSPGDAANTASQGKADPQSSGQQRPANQGQGGPTGGAAQDR